MDRRRLLLGLLAGAASTGLASRGWAQTADWRAAVTEAANAVIAGGQSPGLQLSVWRGSEVLMSQGFGLANIETGTPMGPASVVRIGSVTKQFTAALMLLLQQDGKLALDDRLDRYMPQVPRAADISLRQMLNHTSGIGNYTEFPDPSQFLQAARIDRTPAQLVADVTDRDPFMKFEPGTGWAYSNTAYVLLGVLIEEVAGMALSEAYRTRLFEPLGLTRTALDDAADVVAGRASGYTPRAGGGFDNASFASMTYPGAAGALRSTTDDLCRWTNALHAGLVLNADSLSQMLTPGRLNDGALPTNARGRPVQYGLGLGMGDTPSGRIISHDGGIMGFASSATRFERTSISVAAVANNDAFGGFSAFQRAISTAD